MKKILAVSAFACCAVLMLSFIGCFFLDKKDTEKSYAETMNEKLVSFTDCANAFSDSLEKIADRTYAPSDSQIADMQDKLDRLKKACGQLSGNNAPEKYSEAQSALEAAMADYAEAIDKCGVLLDYYRTYDDLFRKYDSPAKGGAQIEKEERTLYNEFAVAMEKATNSFRNACEKFNTVKNSK